MQRTTAASGGTQRVASSSFPHADRPSNASAAAHPVPRLLRHRNTLTVPGPGFPLHAPVRATVYLVLRLGAIVIVLLPLATSAVLRGLDWAPWLGIGGAVVLGLVVTLARPRSRSLVLLGTMLAAFAGLSAPQLRGDGGPATVIDLRQDLLPADLRGTAEITGFFREEWILAEYAVPEGDLPRQDDAATAQLVPFLGVEEGPIPLEGAVLIVRVEPGREQATGVQTLRGQARALERELLGTFVQASGLQVPPDVHGIMLDTLAPEQPHSPWIRGVLASLAIVAAFACLWIATGPLPLGPAPEDVP